MKVTTKQVLKAIDRDRDFRALKACVKALDKTCSKRMVRPTLEFLWDKFIIHPAGGTSK